MAKTFRLFTYSGDSYIGKTDAISDSKTNVTTIDSPVKVVFTYESATESNAKLTWLLIPVMPNVLIKQPSNGKLTNTMEFPSSLISFSTTIINGAQFDTDLIDAYKSLTGETEETEPQPQPEPEPEPESESES